MMGFRDLADVFIGFLCGQAAVMLMLALGKPPGRTRRPYRRRARPAE